MLKKTTNFQITGIARMNLKHNEGDTTSALVATDIMIRLSPNLKQDRYLENDMPTQEGSVALTSAFISGLLANMQMAEQKGWRQRMDHLEYIVEKLREGALRRATASEASWDDNTINF